MRFQNIPKLQRLSNSDQSGGMVRWLWLVANEARLDAELRLAAMYREYRQKALALAGSICS